MKSEERGKGGRRGEGEGESVLGREREGVTDRLSGCTRISSTQRHMILRSEVILTDEYRAESRLPHKRKGVVFTPRVWKVYFRNPSCQHETVNLSQGRRVTSTNIALFFFTLLLACQNIQRHSLSFKCIYRCNDRVARCSKCVESLWTVLYIPEILPGFGRLQFAVCELCESTPSFWVCPFILNASSHKPSR